MSESVQSQKTVVFNRSNWGRIRLTGADRVRFLHNQTTQNIEQLAAGEGTYTVFVTSTGRTIDLATVYAQEDSLLVVVSPGMAKTLYDWMDRYIFFSDKVTLADESEQTFMLTVVGDGCDEILRAVGAEAIASDVEFSHQPMTIAGADVRVAAGSDLAMPGYTIWGERADFEAVWSAVVEGGAIASDKNQWEHLRIRQGRPMPEKELTADDNPLESGLWNSVSFEKGCYIGQETIARLNTYKGVKKRLWGLALAGPVAVGETVWLGEDKVGKVTSLSKDETGAFGLAYLRTKAGGEGLAVTVDGKAATAVALPFVSHDYYVA